MILKTFAVLSLSGLLLAPNAARVMAQPRLGASQPGGSQKPAAKPPAGKNAPASPQQAERPTPNYRWWTDEAWKKELGLTVQQAKVIDEIYNSAKDELGGYLDNYQRERKELEKMSSEGVVPNFVFGRQIDRTETQRTNYNKVLLLTLYRIKQQLTPEQRAKLQVMQDRERAKRTDRHEPPAGDLLPAR